jgi:hypothetical protein
MIWIGAVVLIGSVSIISGWLVFGNRGETPRPTETIPGVADILLPSATFTQTPEQPQDTPGDIEVEISPSPVTVEPAEEVEEMTPTPGLTGNEKVQLQLIILQRTWVRVTVDGLITFEGRLLPGSVKVFGGEQSIEVLTGNAAGVEVIYNQRDLGVMGLFGEVVDRVYTAEGIATPTPTITPTPTPTDTPEATVTPTQTATVESE